MKIRDYIFRIIAVAMVWFALGVVIIESGVFFPSDMLEFGMGLFSLLCGVAMTLIIWCGPQLVAGILRRTGGAPTHEQQEMERTMVHMAMIAKQNDAIIGLLNEVVERIEGPDPDDGE